jgi:FdhD protein
LKPTRIVRWQEGRSTTAIDHLATEEPLEIRVDSRSVSVTMRTPGHDVELAVGFLVTEGIVRRRAEVRDIRTSPRNRAGNVVDVLLAPEVQVDFARLTRHFFASSSCGLCGKASIDTVRGQFPRVTARFTVTPETLLALPNQMCAAQTTFATTGGLHAAALFTATGELLFLHEDIGRHNAVDKVLGRAFLDRLTPLSNHLLLVSGRTSFELVQKALAAGVALVAAVSAPSSLAVEFARANGQTLVGFLRDGRFNLYAGAKRVQLPRPIRRRPGKPLVGKRML